MVLFSTEENKGNGDKAFVFFVSFCSKYLQLFVRHYTRLEVMKVGFFLWRSCMRVKKSPTCTGSTSA